MSPDTLLDALAYLGGQSLAGLLGLYWFTLIFDVPKYLLAFVAAVAAELRAAGRLRPAGEARGLAAIGRVSVVVAGHNEEDSVERCVRGLREQSLPPDEIVVVSDGSSDRMAAVLRGLQAKGLVDHAHCTHLRAGKAAATNLAERLASGDIIVNVDCDCSFDRDALKAIVAPFADPRVGGVSGNILVRNAAASPVAAFQAIEYLISISLGKRASALTDHVVCVSGGFGAFRRKALRAVAGLDVGGGEDLDVTLRLRKQGWAIRFAADAVCWTDVPATLRGLVAQRFRWERDAVRLRYRKHGDLIRPFSRRLSLTELGHELDFTLFNLVGAAAFPVYVAWLFLAYGDLAPVILVAAQAGLLALDLLAFLLAVLVTPKASAVPLLPYLPGYGLFNGLGMRFVRLAAYAQEWLFIGSVRDGYVPEKVRMMRKW